MGIMISRRTLLIAPAVTVVAGALAPRPRTANAAVTWVNESRYTFERDAALGQVAADANGNGSGPYDSVLGTYNADWFQTSDGRQVCQYDYTRTLSVKDNFLQIRCHVHEGMPRSAAFVIKHPILGERITPGHAVEMGMRVEGSSPFGGVALLWSTNDVWDDGEMDFPEGGFDDVPQAFHHTVGNPSENYAYWSAEGTGINWRDWHTYRIEWLADEVRYLVDGAPILTVTGSIPQASFKYVYQCGVHDPAITPDPQAESTVLIQHIAFDRAEGV